MKHLEISLNNPCSESWDKMKPCEEGRFCAQCTKIVVDFTTMTNVEMLTFFKNNKEKEICGRIRPSQLQKPIPIIAPSPSSLRYAFALAVGVGLTNLTQAESLQTPYFEVCLEDKMPNQPQIPKEMGHLDSINQVVFDLKTNGEDCQIEITALGSTKKASNGIIAFDLPRRKSMKMPIVVKVTFSDSLKKEAVYKTTLKIKDIKTFTIIVEEVPMLGKMCTEIVTEGGKKLVKTKMLEHSFSSFRVVIAPRY